MAITNLNPITDGQTANAGTTINGLTSEVTGTPDRYFGINLLGNGNNFIIDFTESGYIGVTATVDPDNPNKIKAQLYQDKSPYGTSNYYSFGLSDSNPTSPFELYVDVYSYDTPSAYQGTYKFTKKGVGEEPPVHNG